MDEYLTKESLEKGQKLMDIVEEALKNKGFSVDAVKINESLIVRSDGKRTRRYVTGRTFYLTINEKEPASEENIAETSEIGR